jgi:hypothetical protein
VTSTLDRQAAATATAAILARLDEANARLAQRYRGEPEARQPVHTVYGGAHLFKAETARKMGDLALKALADYAPDAATFAQAVGVPERLAERVYARVVGKLRREPVEDLRVDFEDGYGNRADAEEDEHAVRAAEEMARGLAAGTLPPFVGIRVKALTDETRGRAVRTLDLFVTALVTATGGALPPGFVVTLPKVQIPEQVTALVDLFELLEEGLELPPGALKLELMIETTQAIIGPRGEIALRGLVDAARGRCVGAHFGTYDYTASCNVTAAEQRMTHPSASFARHMMQVALARTGVFLSDGATTVMPIGPHRGAQLTLAQQAENRAVVHAAWRVAYENTMDSLRRGFYQGWDLHPAQLPVRYAAVYAFFLDGVEPAAERLRLFVQKAAQASRVGHTFDDAATGQGLLNYFLRAINAGALTEEETRALTGLTLEQLRTRSFARITAAAQDPR